jgi:hypothetical protein
MVIVEWTKRLKLFAGSVQLTAIRRIIRGEIIVEVTKNSLFVHSRLLEANPRPT